MALRFVDSCDHYAIADIGQKWTTITGSPSLVTGRNGSAIRSTQGGNQNVTKSLDAQATWITGFAFRSSTSPSNVTFAIVVRYRDGATDHVDFRFRQSTGTWNATRNGTVLATGTAALSNDTWYYIEVKATIADAGGRAILKINGVTDIDFTGDTRNAGNASADVVGFFGSFTTVTLDIDDIVIADATGSANNDFMGDVRVAALLPSGAGNVSGWTPSSGANYTTVDEASANGDTDYVETSTATTKDTYAMGDLPTVPTAVKGIQIVTQDRKTDAGTRTLRHVVRRSSTDYESADLVMTDSFQMHATIRELDPSTSAAWTESGINAMEAGIKLQA